MLGACSLCIGTIRFSKKVVDLVIQVSDTIIMIDISDCVYVCVHIHLNRIVLMNIYVRLMSFNANAQTNNTRMREKTVVVDAHYIPCSSFLPMCSCPVTSRVSHNLSGGQSDANSW